MKTTRLIDFDSVINNRLRDAKFSLRFKRTSVQAIDLIMSWQVNVLVDLFWIFVIP